MSWTVASLLLLALALAAGFAWYERTRPSARLVALLATLAALGIAGRIAFAAVPNVKPTTDVVLIAGYALGGAPGFVVGAVCALASNLFFGQGSHTPWQMLAWGTVGVFGAVLARAFGRRLGRWSLAVAGAVAAFGFGAITNVGSWITLSGSADAGSLGAYYATGLPFDAAHAAGNVAFALAFGPALAAAIARFRLRFEVTWLPPASAQPDADVAEP